MNGSANCVVFICEYIVYAISCIAMGTLEALLSLTPDSHCLYTHSMALCNTRSRVASFWELRTLLSHVLTIIDTQGNQLVLGVIEILHIDYCEFDIISIYWVVGWIGIQ